MSQKILIETKNLKKSFLMKDKAVEVLKGINLKIYQGEFVIIFGPSGCGKSTLLNVLLGLESPTEGEVYFEGENFYSLTEDQRALLRRYKVGMIYQQPLWISSLTVAGNVGFPLYLLGLSGEEIEKRTNKVLEMVEMEARRDFVPTEISSGQQQKVSLARALVINPILIIADEPTGNLDTVSGYQLVRTFLDLNEKQGKTIIMVTHDLEYLRFGKKVLHMIDGKIVEEYYPKKRGEVSFANGVKKSINGQVEINVRDPELLKKLKL